MNKFKKLSYVQKTVLGLCGKLMQTQEMIYPGARIGVALSGGVDSWVLVQTLLIRQRIVPFDFELMILHLNPGFDPSNHFPLLNWLDQNQLPAHIEQTDFGPAAHSKQNQKKSPCFWCSWQRRKRLFELCAHYRLSHLALGHVLDDLVANFFMNLIQNGRIDGMAAKESFFGGKLMIIRPLLGIEKKVIIQAAHKWNLPIWTNPCPSAQTSKRTTLLKQILTNLNLSTKQKKNIFAGLRRWQLKI